MSDLGNLYPFLSGRRQDPTRLDDALLASFAHEYIGLHGNTHRAELLRNRLDKLRGTSAAQPAQE